MPMPRSASASGGGGVAVPESLADIFQRRAQIVFVLPVRVVLLKAADVADPPDVVADPCRVAETPGHGPSGDLAAECDGLEDRAIGEAAAADIVDLAAAWVPEEVPQRVDEIVAVDVV